MSKHKSKLHNVMLTLGDDFTYQNPDSTFGYVDKLIEMLNKHSKQAFGIKVKAFYSHVDKYFDARLSHGKKYSYYKGDFLPYVQKQENKTGYDYWTGYYTTRPLLKQMVRDLMTNLIHTKIFASLGSLHNFNYEVKETGSLKMDSSLREGMLEKDALTKVEREAVILLHHDAITGTNTDVTYKDYQSRIHKAQNELNAIKKRLLTDTFMSKIPKKDIEAADKLKSLLIAEIAVGASRGHTGAKNWYMTGVFNPTLYTRTEVVYLKEKCDAGI